MTWTILHIIDLALWFLIAGSVAYVVFFAIISLFYNKEDHLALQAASLKNDLTRFLILYPAYHEDTVSFTGLSKRPLSTHSYFRPHATRDE